MRSYIRSVLVVCLLLWACCDGVPTPDSSSTDIIPDSPNSERSLFLIKPDGVQRKYVGDIVNRFENKGFKLVAMKFLWPSQDLLESQYAHLSSKKFFPGMITYMKSGPVVAMVWEGLNVVKTGRAMMGATNPSDASAGTIRGDLSVDIGRNVIHGADSVENAKKEIDLWFKNDELVNNTPAENDWVHEPKH